MALPRAALVVLSRKFRFACAGVAHTLDFFMQSESAAEPSASLPLNDDPLVAAGFFQRNANLIWIVAVFLATVAATVGMMPPSRYPELAYVFAAPAVFWALRAPGWRMFLWTVIGAQMVAWTMILGWLSNVTWVGTILLGAFVGAWVGSWFAAVRWVAPRMLGRPWAHRVLAVLGLAGAWVTVEWTRTWLLSGFPWLTLSATQWQRLSVLQPAAYTGAWGVSFVLISVNVAFAVYAHKLLTGGVGQARTRCPEFIAAMVLLLGCLMFTARVTFNRAQFHAHWANVAIVQPAIPQTVKWDPAEARGILQVLERETLIAALGRPDVLVWPEATTPLAVMGDPGMRGWTEDLVRRARVPLMMGSIGQENLDTPEEHWWNGVFLVEPGEATEGGETGNGGLREGFYAKRHLVPFGEYVPLRAVLGWLEKVVPVGGDFTPGEGAGLLTLRTKVGAADRDTRLGALICYEDIFPGLARESVRAGAEVLVVNTNNGWFGEGAAAYQHAAHSVLRAVETRRPVLRAGNSGWSGWIDECGAIRAVLTKATGPDGRGVVRTEPAARGEDPGTVYFRGSATLNVTRDARFLEVQSLYVRWGDWFVGVSALLALGTWARLRNPYVPPPDRKSLLKPFKLS
jgi:apolipoprotein N-acyltransferase